MGRPYNAKTLYSECTTLCFVVLSLKKCSKCKAVRPRKQFSDNKNRPDGKYSYCKVCRDEHYQENKDKINEKLMDQYWKNRDKHLERFKTYRSDPENKKRIREQNRAYYFSHFFLTRARELDSSVTASDLARLWKKQRGRCGLTDVRLDRSIAHLDHIVPRARDGNDELQNLRWVTREVNQAKRDLLDSEFFELCRLVITKANKEKQIGKYLVNHIDDNKGSIANPQQSRGLPGVIRVSESSLIGLDAERNLLERNALGANKGQASRQPERLNEKTPVKVMR